MSTFREEVRQIDLSQVVAIREEVRQTAST